MRVSGSERVKSNPPFALPFVPPSSLRLSSTFFTLRSCFACSAFAIASSARLMAPASTAAAAFASFLCDARFVFRTCAAAASGADASARTNAHPSLSATSCATTKPRLAHVEVLFDFDTRSCDEHLPKDRKCAACSARRTSPPPGCLPVSFGESHAAANATAAQGTGLPSTTDTRHAYAAASAAEGALNLIRPRGSPEAVTPATVSATEPTKPGNAFVFEVNTIGRFVV